MNRQLEVTAPKNQGQPNAVLQSKFQYEVRVYFDNNTGRKWIVTNMPAEINDAALKKLCKEE